eukprot:3256551-Rhodomonas_salina.4
MVMRNQRAVRKFLMKPGRKRFAMRFSSSMARAKPSGVKPLVRCAGKGWSRAGSMSLLSSSATINSTGERGQSTVKMIPVYSVEDPTTRGEIKHATTGQTRGTAC